MVVQERPPEGAAVLPAPDCCTMSSDPVLLVVDMVLVAAQEHRAAAGHSLREDRVGAVEGALQRT